MGMSIEILGFGDKLFIRNRGNFVSSLINLRFYVRIS